MSTQQTIERPSATRTPSGSYMNIRPDRHWNDAIIPRKPSRCSTPTITAPQLSQRIDELLDLPTRLPESTHSSHRKRLSEVNFELMDAEMRSDLYEALGAETPEGKRRAVVEFIRSHEGVVRWASSLRSLAESCII